MTSSTSPPTDDRQTIPYVRMTDRQGVVREYTVDAVTPELLAKGDRHRMDCMDCHNRPSHQVAATPERAVNEAMARARFRRPCRSSIVRP